MTIARLRLTSVLAALLLLAAACGSDETTAAEDTADASSADDAASETGDDADDSEAAGDDVDDGEAASDMDVDRAREIVAEFSSAPDAIQVSEPVGAEVPTGKTVYFITCGVEICELYTPILESAFDILDWNLEIISTDGSPESVANAWDQVVRDKPDAVLYTGTPRSQVEQQMVAAAANGTEIAGCCVVDPTDDVLDGVIGNAAETGELGEIMAAWVIADASDQGHEAPGTLYVDLPDFPILSELGTVFAETMSELCPDCPQEHLVMGLADLGTLADQVVSALRANPELKYVVLSVDSVGIGLPAAIGAAGLDDVRVFGEGPTLATLQEITSGERPGTMVFPAWENIFAMVDVLVRVEAGVPALDGYPPPNLILTADNIESTSELSRVVPDVEAQYAALWGKE